MSTRRSQRLGAVSGIFAIAAGIVGGAMERGWPSADDPAAVSAFINANGFAVLSQSAGFLISSAFYIAFFAGLCDALASRENGDRWLSSAAFGVSLVWVTLSMLAQGFQIGVATAILHGAPADEGLLWTLASVFGIVNLPAAAMLALVGAAILRDHAFPAWLGWIALLVAISQALLWIGTFIGSGPLSASGWMAYVLYPSFLVWLLPTVWLMLFRGREE